MPSVGFEPTISAGERPQTYPLDRAATGSGLNIIRAIKSINDAVDGELAQRVKHRDT